jgi:Protein of unknown function, DUF481
MTDWTLQKSRRLVITAVVTILVCAFQVQARNDDVVILKNGDRLTGEVKGLQRGELTFKASYMAESVRLDWSKVERLESRGNYQILLTDGRLFTNNVHVTSSSPQGTQNFLIGDQSNATRVKQLDVVRMTPVESDFWSRLDGTVDFGFSFTSGNDQYQTQFAASVNYRREKDLITASVESVFSGQTEGSSSARKQFTVDYRRKLSTNWYAGGLFDLLSSDQQSLDLRTTVGGFVGRSLKQTERTSLAAFAGVVGTREKYSVVVDQERRTNADALAAIDFQTFRFKTTDVRSSLIVFPSLTIPGRVRMQAKSSLRFELFKDLYWGFNVYENFDSKPPLRADKNDFSISTSLGWKF